jgi:hypothetical protein
MLWIELKSKVMQLLEDRDLADPSIRKNALAKIDLLIKLHFPNIRDNPFALLAYDKNKFKEMLSQYKPNKKLNSAESSIVNNFYQILSPQKHSLFQTIEKPIIASTNHKDTVPKKEMKVSQRPKYSTCTLENVNTLLNEENFKSVSVIDDIVPNSPGLYCLKIKEISKLPKYFAEQLTDRKHNIVYIGIASQNLNERLKQELRAKGHGTFFRSIGAVLGYIPSKGSLLTRTNKKNYKYSEKDEAKIIAWINDNLIVNWLEHTDYLESIERELIAKYSPLLNIDKNPFKLQARSDLRAECIRRANET